MSRRIHTRTVKCEEPGCAEYARYEYPNLREYNEAVRNSRTWRCSRHLMNGRVLDPTHLKVEWVSAPSKPLDKYPNDPYRSWGGHGVLIGEGYYADAKDFPTGTRIKITAEILLPEETQ